jgi:hypothetical protein
MHVGLVPIAPGFVALKPGIEPTLPIDDDPGIVEPTLPITDDPGIVEPTLPITDDPGIVEPTLPITDDPGIDDPTLPIQDEPPGVPMIDVPAPGTLPNTRP